MTVAVDRGAQVPAPRRRSCLSVPASSPRMLAKAAGVAADEVVIDLEDAVAIERKADARSAAVAALAELDWRAGAVSVRVNAPGTPWCHQDLIALGEAAVRPATVVVPKVEAGGDLEFVDRLLDGLEAAVEGDRAIGVQALIEGAAGIAQVGEIAGASPRLQALILGYADLAASLGRAPGAAAEPERWLPHQDRVLVAARRHGLQAIDGPFLGVAVDERFHRSCGWAAGLGYDGKWAIHPRQVEALNDAFTPGAADLEHARAVLAKLAEAEAEGAGAVALGDQMLDEAIRRAAERVISRAG